MNKLVPSHIKTIKDMKKLLILFALTLVISIAKAQEEPSVTPDELSHMKFMGIPMDCDAETFSNRLEKEKGLVRGKYGNVERPMLKGTFSGYKDCIIVVYAEDGGNVANVGVVMPTQETFNLLMSQYQTMKSRLMTKYGRPDKEEEGFKNYEPSTDFGRMRELRERNAKFECSFLFKEGMIQLMMTSVDYTGGYIQMFYLDFKNTIKANASTLDDL